MAAMQLMGYWPVAVWLVPSGWVLWGARCPGHLGTWWWSVVCWGFGGWLGVGFGCSPVVGFLHCGVVPGLWPRRLLPGPLWIADHCGALGCWGLWVPWGSGLCLSVWGRPLSHS